MGAQPWLQVPQRYGGKGPSGDGRGSSDVPLLGARAAAFFSTTSHDCKTSLARVFTWPRLLTWKGRRDCEWSACVSCPPGRTVWLSTSPSGTYSAVLLFVLGSCRCGRHADTLGLADDRQQSFFHMHREIHGWSLLQSAEFCLSEPEQNAIRTESYWPSARIRLSGWLRVCP